MPVYNSQATLPTLIDRLAAVLPGVADRFEVVLVNDGSHDGSWEAIGQAARKHAWVRGINLMRNYGQHNALLAGIRAARYAVTVTMDDDLQHPPEEIPRLLAALAQGNDLVYGTPIETQRGLWRRVSSRDREAVAAPRAGSRHRLAGQRLPRVPDRAARGLRPLRGAGGRHRRAPRVVDDPHRVGGRPARSAPPRAIAVQLAAKLARLMLDLTTTFRTWPLRLASLVGFIVMLGGLGTFAFVLLSYLATGRPLSVFRFLASILAIFSGAQLLTLGIMGEYVARIHHRVLREPAYVVRERIGDEPTDRDA